MSGSSLRFQQLLVTTLCSLTRQAKQTKEGVSGVFLPWSVFIAAINATYSLLIEMTFAMGKIDDK